MLDIPSIESTGVSVLPDAKCPWHPNNIFPIALTVTPLPPTPTPKKKGKIRKKRKKTLSRNLVPKLFIC